MKIYTKPDRSEWELLSRRPSAEASRVPAVVRQILGGVRSRGDQALKEFTHTFDGVVLDSLRVSLTDRDSAAEAVDDRISDAITQAIGAIRAFHSTQLVIEDAVETVPGITCYRRSVPIERVGIYIPGGSAPLFSSLLMLAIPAQLAGCEELALCTPVSASGQINPVIALCAQKLQIDELYLVGGAQAIGAMAYGTETIKRVHKICGPGNAFVTEAKLQVAAEGVPIDMGAGPSEVLVIADAGADPRYVAADLLAQAEHGADSQMVVVTPCTELVPRILAEVERQLSLLPRQAVAEQALRQSFVVVTESLQEAVAFSNVYAPEHLILSVTEPEVLAERVVNAGSVFLGYWAAEALGDYASGTNHVLPTNGSARGVSGVSVDTFMKKITFQRVSERGLRNLAPTVTTMAKAEGLEGHARAVSIREEVSSE
jgi:histidinol dehydrogenase